MRITLSNSFLITTLVSLVTFDCYQNSTFASKTIVFTILSVGFIFYFIWQIILSKKDLFVSSIDLVVFVLLVHIISNALIKGTINSLRYYDLISCYAYYLFLRNVIKIRVLKFFFNTSSISYISLWFSALGNPIAIIYPILSHKKLLVVTVFFLP